MATQAHCAYCFESLAADLEKRSGLSLDEVEALWNRYNSADNTEADADQSLAAPLSSRPAAISRLLASTPSSGSSSSSTPSTSTPGSFTPSGTSANSSATSLSSEDKTPQEHPLFVTWNTLSRGDKRLRGCIGTFSPQELDDGLKSYAVTSALHDTRFSPVTLRELPSLSCAVTLLTDFEPASDPYAWDLGTHGIRLSFTHHGRRYGGTFLPDVAVEQGWTKEETLTSLMRKAGWRGKSDEWKSIDLHVVRYQGTKVSLDYDEWKAWRKWVDGQEK